MADTNAQKVPEIEKLKADIAALREDISAIGGVYSERVRNGARQAASDISARTRDGATMVAGQIESRPLTSVLVAFGAGLALGKLLDHRS